MTSLYSIQPAVFTDDTVCSLAVAPWDGILRVWVFLKRLMCSGGPSMSRRAVIYCCGSSAHKERTTMDQLCTVARKHGWTVVKAVHRPEASRTQPAVLTQLLAESEADLLIVPSFAAMADTVADVLEEIVRLRDAGCDLYVHDAELDTTSPIDRVLFRIADGLRSIERAGAKRPVGGRTRQVQTKKREPTPYQRSVIRGALKSGMKPREVAKFLKVPIGVVQAVAKAE
jgi:DNA invertase Pin-like site-specific DNA recombinase